MFNESIKAAWRARYGTEPPSLPEETALFLRHRSIRRYSQRPVDESLVSGLMSAAQSAATSSSLQLWSAISVQDPKRRAQIARLCADQKQVHEAPWFFAFFADCNRVKQAATKVGEDAKGLDYAEFFTMAVIDAALAAERFVCAAESLGLGICYIGALRNDVNAVQDFFGLPPLTFGVFGLCVGYPDEKSTAEIKPRLSQDSVWFRERYPEQIDVSEYDARMTPYYASQNMKGENTWSMRSGRRVDENHLTGREALMPWLQQQGFLKR